MGYPESQSQQGIDELRAILLGEDRQAMDGLREQLALMEQRLSDSEQQQQLNGAELAQLSARVGDERSLRDAMIPVLSETVEEIEKSNPRPLSRALSPFIVSSIRSEIANSKEAMVEALYPITGRLVSAAVKSSVASMMETINQRVDEATSTRMLNARFQSWRSGEPVSAYLIPAPGEVTFHSAMLMERHSGAPICHVDPTGEEPVQEGRSNLVSGLLAALSNLTEEVFTGADDELRTLDLNGRKITLRRSLRHLLVVEFVGTLSADQHRAIDEHFGEVVSLSEGGDHAGLSRELTALMSHHEEPSESDPKKSFAKTVLGIAGVALLIWLAWGAWQSAQLRSAAETLKAKINASAALASYPLQVLADQEAQTLLVKGLIPESHDPVALRLQWQEWAPDYPLSVSLAPIADAARAQMLEDELNLLRAENRALRLSAQSGAAGGESLRDGLSSLLEGRHFSFGANGELVDEARALTLLKRAARLMIAADLRLEVIALVADGAPEDLASAQRIAALLSELGVRSSQLELASRPAQLADQSDRRVILELLDETP